MLSKDNYHSDVSLQGFGGRLHGTVSEEFAKMHSIMKLNFLVKRKQNIMQTNVDGIETFAQIFIEYSLHNSASLE